MEKLKTLFSKIGENTKELLKHFPITLIIIVITTIIIAFFTDISGIRRSLIYEIIEFGIVLCFGVFATECCVKSKSRKIFLMILAGIISLGFVKILNYSALEMTSSILAIQEITTRMLALYIVFTVAYAIYTFVKQSDGNLEGYLAHVFSNVLIVSIIYAVLAIGVLLVSVIFVSLILDYDYDDIIYKLQIVLFGGYYIPSLIYAFTNKKEISKIARNLSIYVLLPLVTIAVGIIYMYIIKIITQWSMPENFVFRIIAGIFVIACPVWLIAGHYKNENKFANKISKLLPYLFIPLIILEAYSMYLRIAEFGVTPLRYISAIFVVLQLIMIALCIYKNGEKVNNIFIYVIILAAITTISPINMQMVSNWNQRSIIEKYMDETTSFEKLDNDTQRRVSGAYYYLKSVAEADKYIPSYVKDIPRVTTTNEVIYDTVYWAIREESIQISGYNELIPIEIHEKAYKENAIYEDVYENNKIPENLDIEKYVKEILKQEQREEYISKNNELIISENEKLVITSIDIMYTEKTNEANYISIIGYLLRK